MLNLWKFPEVSVARGSFEVGIEFVGKGTSVAAFRSNSFIAKVGKSSTSAGTDYDLVMCILPRCMRISDVYYCVLHLALLSIVIIY